MTDRSSDPTEVTVVLPHPADGTTVPTAAPGRSASPRTRRQGVLTLAAGVVLLVSAPVAWFALQPAPAGQEVSTVGADRAAALQDPSAGAAAPTDSSTSPSTTNTPAAPADPGAGATDVPAGAEVSPAATAPAAAPPTADPAAATATPAVPTDPARIRVAALGVHAAVVPIGVQESGELEIPADVSTVGWYRYGPVPASTTGSAVLSGHVDAADQGPGTFARLGDLQPGDTIVVTDSAGVERTFSVVSREEWNKADVPLDRIFDRGGEGRLVLITCGGAFDRETLGYQDNIAVTAVLSEG